MLDEYQNCQVCATQGEDARDWKWMGTGASCLAEMKCHSSGTGGGALSARLKTVPAVTWKALYPEKPGRSHTK